MPTQDQVDYLIGQIEGDGCIHLSLPKKDCHRNFGTLQIKISKSTKNIPTLEWFRDTFGGVITGFSPLSERDPYHNDALVWEVKHASAVSLCKQLAPHAHIKARQFDMASRLPADAIRRTKYRPVKITRGPESHAFESCQAASMFLNRTLQAVHIAFKNGGLCAGWKVESHELFTRDQVKQLVHQMYWCLRLMKQTQEDPVTRPLSLPYVAGLFDAEGSLSIAGNRCVVRISQKDPAIRDALERQFGGKSHGIDWYTNSIWREFLGLIAPYCIEKRAQVDLVLSMNGNGAEIKAKIGPMQRNKRPRLQ